MLLCGSPCLWPCLRWLPMARLPRRHGYNLLPHLSMILSAASVYYLLSAVYRMLYALCLPSSHPARIFVSALAAVARADTKGWEERWKEIW